MLRVARGQLHSSGVGPMDRLSNSWVESIRCNLLLLVDRFQSSLIACFADGFLTKAPRLSLKLLMQVSKILSMFEPPSPHSQAARRTRSSTNMSGEYWKENESFSICYLVFGLNDWF